MKAFRKALPRAGCGVMDHDFPPVKAHGELSAWCRVNATDLRVNPRRDSDFFDVKCICPDISRGQAGCEEQNEESSNHGVGVMVMVAWTRSLAEVRLDAPENTPIWSDS